MEITQERLAILQEALPGNAAIYCVKAEQVEALYISPGLARLNGMTWEEYKKVNLQNPLALVFPEDLPKLWAAVKQCVKTGEEVELNYRVFHKIHDFDWAHATFKRCGEKEGKPVFVGIFANASIETGIYQKILDHTKRRIYVCDKNTYELLYANKAAKEFADNKGLPLFQQKCYSFIRGQEAPCEDCWLKLTEDDKGSLRKLYDEKKQLWEQSTGIFMDWCGHDAFVQYVDDISENERQKTLLQNTFAIEQRLLRANRILNGKEDINVRINKLLQDMGEYLQAERSYLFMLKEDRLYNTHEWCKEGVKPEIANLQELAVPYMARWLATFQTGKCLIVDNIEKIKKLNPTEYALMRARGIHSYIEAPVFYNGVLRGFLGVDNPEPDWQEKRPASMIGNILLSLSYSLSDVLEKAEVLSNLQQSQQRYAIAVASADLAVWEYDIKQHKMTNANGKLRKYHIPETLENVPEAILPYVLPADREKMRAFYRRLEDGEKVISEEFWLQGENTASPVCERTFYSIVKDKQGKAAKAYGISMDITAQKRQSLKFTKAMDLLLTANPDAVGMLQFNLTKNLCNEKHAISATTHKMLQANNLDELFATIESYIISEEDKAAFRATFNRKFLLEQFAKGITTHQIEYYRRKVDAGPVWIKVYLNLLENPNTRDIEGVIYSSEISREKQLEEISHIINSLEYDLIALIHLDTKQIEAVTLGDSLPDCYRQLCPAPGTFCSFAQMQAATKDWLSAEDWPDYLRHTNPDYIKEALDKKGRFEYLFRLRLPASGTIMYRKAQCYYLNGRKEEILVTESDVTSTYQAQQEEIAREKELRKQAEAANAAKTEFLSRMSHDIRTPLNGIMGMAYIAREQTDPVVLKKCLDNIDISSQFLLGLINEILDMAKVEKNKLELHPEPYKAQDFAAYMEAVIRPLCRDKNQKLLLDIKMPEDYYALQDKLSINRVVFNLLSNAVKYTPEGGTIWYKAEGSLRPDKKQIALHVEVRDNGIGISREFQKVIFEPFSQENRDDNSNLRGSGLGLAITKKLVELMGGTIKVESELGKGTTFIVDMVNDCVPAAGVVPQPEKTAQRLGDFSLLKGKHVLLCEDHPLNRQIARILLAKQGMLVDEVENGQEGLRQFQLVPLNYYDVILMDIRMPIMDGLTAAKRLRELNRADAKNVPIVAMTANTFPEDIKNCLAAGMNTHLAKPINPQLLYETLAQVIANNY